MNAGLFTLLNFGISLAIAVPIIFKAYNWKQTTAWDKDEEAKQWFVPPERTAALRELYIKIYKTLSTGTAVLKAAAGSFSDLFYHAIMSDVQLLRKFGITRVIDFVLNEKRIEKEEEKTMVTATDGNLAFTETDEFGALKEVLLDTTTGQPLKERHYKIALCSMEFNRNPSRLASETVYCIGCDTELYMSGEFIKCHICGNTYTADSYAWMATNLRFSEADAAGNIVHRNLKTGKMDPFQIGGYAATILIFGTMILGFINGSSQGMRNWAYFLGIIWDIVLLVAVMLMLKKRKPSQSLMAFDPNCNPQRVTRRAAYLVSQAHIAAELNPQQMMPFMDEGFFQHWRSSLEYPEDRIINVAPSYYDDVIKAFWADGYRQYVKVVSTFAITTINSMKEIKERLDYFEIDLYRNINARYTNTKSADILLCPGCGSSINMTADARCKYCGTIYDIADYDWKMIGFTKVKASPFALFGL